MLNRREFLRDAALVVAALRTGYASGADRASEHLVRTPSGQLRGVLMEDIAEFRGVPFAQPPVGEMRFRPPVFVKPWAGVRDATRFAPAACQPGGGGYAQSEDCLYLNIWAPQGAGPFPVYVWIHGGGFTGGRASDPVFDGRHFANMGVICVTVAYRLGVFGFLDAEPLLGSAYAGSANNGLRDLMAALEWVNKNIESFGGDPQRVTVGGESAGAKLTDLLMGVPSAGGLFHQMISESGGADRVWPRSRSLEVGGHFADIWRSLGKEPGSMLQADPKLLLAAQERLIKESPVHFPLRAEVDGEFIKRSPLSEIRAGSTKGKRLLIGTNRDESALFLGPHPGHDATDEDLGNLPLKTFRPIDDAYRKLFPSMDPELRRIRSVTAEEYWIPSMRVLEAHVSGGNEAYLYRMDLPGEGRFANLAVHAAEIRLVWDETAADGRADAEGLAPLMHDAWVSFIHGGAPAAKGLPSWPVYRLQDPVAMIFDASSHVERAPQAAELSLWDGYLAN